MHFVTLVSSSDMPDTKADDEVDFLMDPRPSSASEDVAAGDTAAPSGTGQGLKTQAVSGLGSSPAQGLAYGSALRPCFSVCGFVFFFMVVPFPFLACPMTYTRGNACSKPSCSKPSYVVCTTGRGL